jgi:hypothetical protein
MMTLAFLLLYLLLLIVESGILNTWLAMLKLGSYLTDSIPEIGALHSHEMSLI